MQVERSQHETQQVEYGRAVSGPGRNDSPDDFNAALAAHRAELEAKRKAEGPSTFMRVVNATSNVALAGGGVALYLAGHPVCALTAGTLAALGNTRANPVSMAAGIIYAAGFVALGFAMAIHGRITGKNPFI